jgi:hypothetical protein
MSALRTSFDGIGAISDGSFVAAVGAGGVASVERARIVNEVRRRVGLAKTSEQTRRRDIGLVETLKRSEGRLGLPDSGTSYFGIYLPRPIPHVPLVLIFYAQQ